ncbi:hypothetical protein B7486_32965 [cyanobacterium TDX16]|nr:hypothetical protein B7486_32965 [cyanobacterium TDX16]
MFYLAQIIKYGISGKLGLKLLASQEAEHTWVLVSDRSAILDVETTIGDRCPFTLAEGLLVLAELSPDCCQVYSLQNAADWVMELVQTYLTSGITPLFLQQEMERAEKWRQTLTLQTQELSRRALEVEARREQIQALETNVRREQEEDEAD